MDGRVPSSFNDWPDVVSHLLQNLFPIGLVFLYLCWRLLVVSSALRTIACSFYISFDLLAMGLVGVAFSVAGVEPFAQVAATPLRKSIRIISRRCVRHACGSPDVCMA
jgi:hypothetical protein